MAAPLKYSAKRRGPPEPTPEYAEYNSRPPVDGCRPGGNYATTKTSNTLTSPLARSLGSRGEGFAVVGPLNPDEGAQRQDDDPCAQPDPSTQDDRQMLEVTSDQNPETRQLGPTTTNNDRQRPGQTPPERAQQRRGVTTPTPPQRGPGLHRHRSPNTLHNPETNDPSGEPQRPRNTPNGTLTQPRRKRKQTKIASLNMNGRGEAHDKWGSINNVMKKWGIAILALQETHPTDRLQETVSKRFRNTLVAVHSANPDNPNTTGGVSFAINKSLIDATKITHQTIIHGRVIMLEIPWGENDKLTIMNVYAPIKNAEKTAFWEELLEKLESEETPDPDIILGDFNLVENPEIDRMINRGGADPQAARNAMSNLTTTLNLTDGWRRRHPKKRGFTYTGNGQSRLDRIHTKEDVYPWCEDWRIEHPGLKTDHNIVSVKITSENMPFIGKGRWAIPVNLLKNKQLKKETQRLAVRLQAEVTQTEATDRPTVSPQRALKAFKEEVRELYRTHQRTHQPRMENAINSLKKELENKADTPGLTEDEIHEHTVILRERIDALEKKRRDEARLLCYTRNRLEGETMSKHWVRSAKENTPRDTIRALRNPLEDETYRVTRSDKMAELAKNYHEQLLSIDRNPREAPNEAKLEKTLENIQAELSPGNIEKMKEHVDETEVTAALRDMANDKAAGLDGIPVELWKLLHQQYKSAKPNERHKFCNITQVLTTVFKDIAEHGIAEGTNFNEGWMCPIYKKKEADNIANYRPITILNTDYKVFTKAIATRLTDVAPSIIHPDQAGFIRGRSIFDQIEQTTTTINYARLKEINGAIVALDQEKAYDKITHPYLWKILEKFKFPAEMIKTIQTLYTDAPTSIIINGVISDPFIVSRGVRQGDPMSCILFNLSIEPLAANIRASQIKGIEVPNLEDKVKVSLFADDTTVILTEHDSFNELITILNEWCETSGAKFNVEKTEIIPIGSKDYRKKLTQTRKMNETSDSIPESIHITSDRDTTRILGAWVGNETNPEEPWRKIVETIKKDLTRWEARFPTLEGKRHIIQMIVGGKTQFLTRAQGMPETIQEEIQKMITEFIWNKERATMSIEDIARSPDLGGRKVMNIAKRNEAIDLMWIKQYLNMGPDRPKWAFLRDEIFRMERPKQAKEPQEIISNWNPFTQDWRPNERSTKIPKRIQRAMRLAKKHGVELEALEPSNKTKEDMPVWLHRKASREAAKVYKTDGAKCLKSKHRTHYIKQLTETVRDVPDEHRKTNFCTCGWCQRVSRLGCTHPNKCLETAMKILDAIAPKWRPRNGHPPETQDPEQTTNRHDAPENEHIVNTQREPTDLKHSIRIFTDRENLLEATTLQTTQDETLKNTELIVYTDGSCTDNGTEEARAGSGIWYGHDDPRNAALRTPGRKQTNQIGEIFAILHAIKNAYENQPMKICSDSKFTIEGLTKHAKEWEEKNWMGITHGPLFKCATAWLRARTAKTTLQWVKGHAGIEGNEEADKLAAEGSQKETDQTEMDLGIPADTMTTGAKLAQTSQSLIYRDLTNRGNIRRITTERTIMKIKDAIKDTFQETPTDEAIWKSMRHRDITRKIKDFLWKNAHGIYKLGDVWKHIPGYENRATCPICQKSETLEHIITECNSTERKTVWEETNKLWSKRYNEEITITEGTVLGGGIAKFKKQNNKPDTTKNRLYRILITESAHLIWVLRCERRIENEDEPSKHHTANAVRNRWYKKINERMQIDCLLTNTYLYERKALNPRKVHKTWEQCTTSTEALHREWCRHPGVLVGKTPVRLPGETGEASADACPVPVPHRPA